MVTQSHVGIVHGRLQPLHNEHLKKYILAAYKQCEFLIVGITNPDPALTGEHAAAPHRTQEASNPFTYYERALIVQASLLEAGLGWEDFMVVPFPINKPEYIKYYVPTDATFFMTIYDKWGHAKRELLENQGFRVEVLCEEESRDGTISSTQIRERMAHSGPWEKLVPEAAARVIKQRKLDQRVARLMKEQPE
ncbi:MAG: nicotinate-nucleotide adenylyltransferase [Verrucomicrobia bacterium]|nr:nicotinate-nucleotide adenylyltransferase [Verrucomicrobiota bacterium]